MTREHLIVINPDGSVAWIHDDALRPLAESFGGFEMRRAAFVEPTADGRRWEARLPCGELIAGPLDRHADAIAAERAAVEELMLSGGMP